MSCPFNKDVLDKLKQFIQICQSNNDILHVPELNFFKEFIESFGGKVPTPTMSSPSAESKTEPEPKAEEVPDDDVESDLELDLTGCIEPDVVGDDQVMGDPSKEVPEEESDKADEKRREAMSQFSEGNFEKAITLFTEAIVINPQSALLFAKRGQAYLKLNKPNACIKDCTRALELNCDSASAYKFRGKAYRLIGEWEMAAKDLRQACNIDFDEQTDEWLKEVTPNAKKIEQHKLKQERVKLEKNVHAKKDKPAGAPSMPNMEGIPPNFATPDLLKLMQDPEIVAAFQDPEVNAAFQDISTNFTNFVKYKDNPKVMNVIKKLSEKLPSGAGAFGGLDNLGNLMGGLGNLAGGLGNLGGAFKPPQTHTDDDNLD